MTTNPDEPELPPRPDPEADKQRALNQAARKTAAARKAIRVRNATIWFAHESGASYRTIADITGIPFRTIARIVEQHEDDFDDTSEPGAD